MTKRGRPQRDLTGVRSGRLTVLYLLERRGSGRERLWFCACDCGGETIVSSRNLTYKPTKSCGCLYVEARTKLAFKIDRYYENKPYRHKQILTDFLLECNIIRLAEPSQARIEQTEFHCLQ